MRKTVYVIGAGAGVDIGMPLGSELKEQIIRSLQFPHPVRLNDISTDYHGLLNALLAKFNDIRLIQELTEKFTYGLKQSSSIDNYIRAQGEDPNITIFAKLLIAAAIINAEHNSVLGAKPDDFLEPAEAIEKSWLPNFFRALTGEVPFDELSLRFGQITIINFNYDRCIENYLYHTIGLFYGKQNYEVHELLRKLDIFHPYGMLAPLGSQEGRSVGYGVKADSDSLRYMAGNIKTFNEEVNSDPAYYELLAKMRSASNVVFLGFHYHSQNMKLLGYDGHSVRTQNDRVDFGTAIGLSDYNIDVVKNWLAKIRIDSNQNVRSHLRSDLNCRQLLEEYSLALM